MSLLDRLRDAQDEPARHRASPYVGPSILTVDQLRAMERALEVEGFLDRDTSVVDVVDVAPVTDDPPVWDVLDTPVDPVRDLAPEPAIERGDPAPVVELLPVWAASAVSPSVAAAARPTGPIEPLPLWTPPVFEPQAELESCPNCGEELAIDRIDLTANASWLTCRSCGLRWGGTIERPEVGAAPIVPALPRGTGPDGNRGRAAAG